MMLETFFENFEFLAETPNALPKLRELILQLAVQGKLVSQDSNDEIAKNLLKDIQAVKESLLLEGKLQQNKKFSPVIKTSPPWKIPSSWVWIRLQDIFEISRGGSPRPSGDPSYFGGDIPWITVYEITKDTKRYLRNTNNGLTELGSQKSRFIYPRDLLLSNSGATLGVPKISTIKGCINDGVARFYSFHHTVYQEYAYFYLLQQTSAFRLVNQGMGQPNLNTSILAGWFFPLPPTNEQKRIVAKVDELMSLCDELEERQKKKRQTHVLLNNAAINQLLTAREPDTFAKHWQRICDNFDLLYSAPENIGKLRQAILQLAVMGKLVPQNPNDEPASVLLDKIKFEKEWLIKEGKIKKFEKSLPVKAYQATLELPKGWLYVCVGECIDLISGQHLDKNEQNDKEEGLPYLTGPSDFGKINPTATRWTLTPKAIAEKNDILITVKGAGVGKINILGLSQAAIGRQLMAIRPILVDINYIYLLIVASYEQFQNLSTGSTVPGIGREDILKFILPLPPQNEQKRIVIKVDQLMTLCDELEAKLTQSQTDSEKLMDAAVRQLLVV